MLAAGSQWRQGCGGFHSAVASRRVQVAPLAAGAVLGAGLSLLRRRHGRLEAFHRAAAQRGFPEGSWAVSPATSVAARGGIAGPRRLGWRRPAWERVCCNQMACTAWRCVLGTDRAATAKAGIGCCVSGCCAATRTTGARAVGRFAYLWNRLFTACPLAFALCRSRRSSTCVNFCHVRHVGYVGDIVHDCRVVVCSHVVLIRTAYV